MAVKQLVCVRVKLTDSFNTAVLNKITPKLKIVKNLTPC
jgi:hypothetical protein